jgi:magnesium transporter
MPELHKPWAYPLVIGVVATLVGSIFVFLKRAKWL